MDNTNNLFPDHAIERPWPESGFDRTLSNSEVHIADRRMARLLLVLHELDRSVAGLEGLPQTELSELVSNAILSCGFEDATEARHAIAAVLSAIEMPDKTLEDHQFPAT